MPGSTISLCLLLELLRCKMLLDEVSFVELDETGFDELDAGTELETVAEES